jgi:hypothetical protein
MATRIQLRRDTSASWTSVNPTLAVGELGYETDTGKMKLGDGLTAWTSLNYYYFTADLSDLSDVTISSAADGDFLRWNGSSWVNDAVNLGTDSVGDYIESITAGTGVTVFGGTGESASATISIGQDVGTNASVSFVHVSADVTGNVTGNIIGNVTGNVTGNADTASTLQTGRTIALTGDVTGSVVFDGSENVEITTTVSADSVALGTDTTGDYVESLIAGTGVSIDNGTGEGSTPTVFIGQDVGTSASVSFAKVETTGDVTVGGNLTVNGTTTTINAENLYIEDNVITLNSNVTGSPTLNAGIEIERGTEPNAELLWVEQTQRWAFTNDGSNFVPIPVNVYDLSDVNLSTAASAVPQESILYWNGAEWTDVLPTLRPVLVQDAQTGDFLRFDGTVWENAPINLGSDTVGDYVEDITAGTGVTVYSGTGEGSNASISIGQDVSTGASVTFSHVQADVTGNLTGNADTASTLQTGRTIELIGDVAGSVSFDGSSNVQISTTVQSDSVALGSDTVGDYVESIFAGTGVTVYSGTGEGSNPSVAIGQDVSTGASVTFVHVSADLLGNVQGNSDTASALLTGRTISLTGDVTGSTVFDGTSDVSITAAVEDGFAGIDILSDVTISSATNGQILQFDGTNWVNTVQAGGEPIGHENRLDSSVSFNNANRTFTIEPASTSFTVWCKGKRFVKSTASTVVIDDVTGLYYIYFNSSGVLSFRTTYFEWANDTPTAYIYWNASTGKAEFFADERHGVTLDWQTHEYLHRTRGASIADGFGASNFVTDGNGSSDSHTQLALAGGTFFDEDLKVAITHEAAPTANTWEQVLEGIAEIPVFYRSGTAWVKDTATSSPIKAGSSLAAYNNKSGGSWSVADLSNNKYGSVWIVATNNLNEPIISILGQSSHNNSGAAEAEQWSDLDLDGLPIFELRPLYKVVFVTNSQFTNTLKSAIRGVYDIRRAVSAGDGVPAESVSDHGSMTGLGDDDHLQYLTNERHDAQDHTAAMTSVVLYDISDVAASAPVSGEFLKWSGSSWNSSDVTLGSETSGDYVESVAAGTGVVISGGTGEGSTPTIFIGQNVAASAAVTFDSVTISSTPTQAAHAVTKAYVDNVAAGISWHDAVRFATAAVLPDTPSYNNGVSGVGATLTASALNRLNIDGSPVVTGDRVLIKNQVTAAHNGVYEVTEQGANSVTAWVLTRSTDFDGGSTGVVDPGEAVFVLAGAINVRQGFVVSSTSSPHSIGVDDLNFTQFTGTQAFTAGDGLSQTGNTLNVGTANSGRIVVGADTIDLAEVTPTTSTGSATTIFVSGATVDAYGRVTATSSASVDFNNVSLTGVPTAPTATTNTDTTQVATTEFVNNYVDTYSVNLDDFTAKGDLLAGSGVATVSALGAGTNGYFLKANGSTTTGLEWGQISSLNDIVDVSVTPSDNDLLRYDAATTSWVNDTISIGMLDNVNDDSNSATTGDVLQWTGTEWDAAPLTLSSTTGDYVATLSGGTGVTIYGSGSGANASISIGQDVSTGASVSFAAVTADVIGTVSDISNHSLDDLSDVNITSVQSEQFLKWSGSAWINSAVPQINSIADISDVALATPTNGEVLKYNGSTWVNSDILANTALTGVPTAPTATTGTSTTQIATTAFVSTAVSNLVDSAPTTLNTLNELAAALGDDANFATTVSTSLGLKANLDGPTFTGTVTLPATTHWPESYTQTTLNGKTLALADRNIVWISSDSSTATVTVPANSSVAFPTGTVFTFIQGAAGLLQIAAAGGVTIQTSIGLKLREQWSSATLRKIGTDTWHLSGDLKA